MNRKVIFVILLSVFVGQVAYAEGKKSISDFGNAAYGANRRVQTNAGYIAVRGTFSEPEIYVPPINLDLSKPTYYFGSEALGIKTEGGVQFEHERRIVNGTTYEPGWSFFIRTPPRNDSGWTSPKLNGKPIRIKKGSLGTLGMTYFVTRRGGIFLDVSGSTNLSFWGNPNQDGSTYKRYYSIHAGVITKGTVDAMKLRRIIGMTQSPRKGDYAIDHSKSINNQFNSGDIAKLSFVNGRPELSGNILKYNWEGSWNSVDHGKQGTGYYPGGKDKTGDWIFDFSFDGMAPKDSAGNYRDASIAARYNTERVDINLKRWGARNRGKDLKGNK